MIAAVFSRQFLATIYSKLLRRVGDVEEDRRLLKEKLEIFSTERDVPPENISEDALKKHGLTKGEYDILREMQKGQIIYRSLPGLIKGAKLSQKAARDALGSLMTRGFVEQRKDKKGDLRYYVSPNGSGLIDQLPSEQQSEEAG